MRYSQTHSPESQSLILNNKYTSWSAYFGVDAFLNAVWHNVFSMSVLASLLFLSVTIGAMSLPPPTHFYTKHTGAAENSSSSSSSSTSTTNKLLTTFFSLRRTNVGGNKKGNKIKNYVVNNKDDNKNKSEAAYDHTRASLDRRHTD